MDQSPHQTTLDNLLQDMIKRNQADAERAQQERVTREDATWAQEQRDREERAQRVIAEQAQPRAVWERMRAEQERDETLRWLMRNCDLDNARQRKGGWGFVAVALFFITLWRAPWTFAPDFPEYAGPDAPLTWALVILLGWLALLYGVFRAWLRHHDEVVALERGWWHPYANVPIPSWIYLEIEPLDLLGFTGPTAYEAARRLRDRWRRLSGEARVQTMKDGKFPDEE